MKYQESLKDVLRFFTKGEKIVLMSCFFAQCIIGLLDILGVLSISITSLFLVRGSVASTRILDLLPSFLPTNTENLIQFFALASIVCLLIKSLSSFFVTRYLLYRLSGVQTRLVNRLFYLFLHTKPNRKNTDLEKLPEVLSEGIGNLIIGFIGFSMLAAIESVLFVMLLIPLLIIAPVLFCCLLLIFSLSFILLHKLLSKWAIESGNQSKLRMENIRELTSTVQQLSKMIWVMEEFRYFNNRMNNDAQIGSKVFADTFFVQQIPKYILELSVIIIGILTAVYLSLTGSFGESVGILALLLATSFRLLPGMLRIQGAVLVAKTSFGKSYDSIEILKNFGSTVNNLDEILGTGSLHVVTSPIAISIEKLTFSYPNQGTPIFDEFSANIPAGKITVIKGSSGIGKTTLVDLILGIQDSYSGHIKFTPEGFGKKSYMPQDSRFMNTSIAENLAFAEEISALEIVKIGSVIEQVGLDSIIQYKDLTLGAQKKLDNLSGGQKQRLALARALYQKPVVLVLDEPTSSLDHLSEIELLELLSIIKSTTTIIIIAHSNTPLIFADNIINLDTP